MTLRMKRVRLRVMARLMAVVMVVEVEMGVDCKWPAR